MAIVVVAVLDVAIVLVAVLGEVSVGSSIR